MLQACKTKIEYIVKQKGVWDEEFLKGQVEQAGRDGDEALKKVWKGYTSRWGIGCIGWGEDGRMKLAWERPEKDKGKGKLEV